MRERTSPASSSQVSLPTSPGPPSPAPRYSHPDGYHSTASSVLTRTASSPSQPISHASYSPRPATTMAASQTSYDYHSSNRDDQLNGAHKRGARSMSSLKGSVSAGDLSLRASAPADDIKGDQEGHTIKPRGGSGGASRHSVDGATAFARPRHSSARSVDELFGPQTINSKNHRGASGPWKGGKLSGEDWQSRNPALQQAGNPGKRVTSNPKTWGSQELAKYLVRTLQAEGDKENGNHQERILGGFSKEAVEAVEDWVRETGIDGKQFLSIQTDTSTIQPPAETASALHAISRNLRRISLGAGGQSSTGSGQFSTARSMRQESSVLLEQDETPDAVLKIDQGTDYFGVTAGHRPRSSSISSVSSSSSRTSVSERIALIEGSGTDARRTRRESIVTPRRSKAEPAEDSLVPFPASVPKTEPITISQVKYQLQSVKVDDNDKLDTASSASANSITPLETPPMPFDAPIQASPLATPAKVVSRGLATNDSTPRKANDTQQAAPDLLKVSAPSEHMDQHVKSGSRPYGALKRNHSSGSATGAGRRLPTVGLLRKSQDSAVFLPDTPLTPKALAELADTLAADPDDRDTSRRVTIRPHPKVTEMFPAQSSPSSPQRHAGSGQLEARLQEYQSEHLALLQRLTSAEARVHALEEELMRRNGDRQQPLFQALSTRIRDMIWQTATQPIPPYAWAAIGGITAFVVMSLSRRLANAAGRHAA